MNKIRNIVAVDRMPVAALQAADDTYWQSIRIKVPARLTLSDKIEDGVRMYSAKLVFRTCEDLESVERQAYLCRAADGSEYVIGCTGRPYPITTITDDHPDNMTDSQLYEVTVNYTSPYKIPVI